MSDNKTPIDEPINVEVAFKSFRDQKFFGVNSLVGQRKIMPLRFRRKNGDEHRITELRATRPFRKGEKGDQQTQIHYVVRTLQDRYFDIVYNMQSGEWRLLYEIDDQMIIELPG